MRRIYTLWIIFFLFVVCTDAQPTVKFTPVVLSGPALASPLCIRGAGDGSGRLFIVEKRGTIRIIQNKTVLPGYFLDIRSQVINNGERGLLGLAFHPQFPDSPYVYVNYVINGTITNRISRFTLNPDDPNDLLENSELVLLEQTGVQTNHKAGDLVFGPDGYLYIGFGDGGGAYDPNNNGQNLNIFLAKIIRIDINSKTPPHNYSIPPDNPFVGVDGLDEIWYYGMRNPWRISFDRQTGDFWIGDVGQDKWEEVDFVPAGTAGGLDFGWDCQEGNHPVEPQNCDGNTQYTWPIFEYPHTCDPCPNGKGASVIGGYVYRGYLYPDLNGYYICADYVSNYFWLIRQTGTNPLTFATSFHDATGMINAIVSFGEDDNGELYACNLDGVLYSISTDSLLPFKWESIDAWHIPNGNRVEWTVNQALSIDHFEVQRAASPDFNKSSTVAVVSPVQNQTHYGYDDAFLQTNAVYYRVVAYLINSSQLSSSIARLINQETSQPALIFDAGSNNWRLSLPEEWQTGDLAVYDLQGREVFSKKLDRDKSIELSLVVVPGCYFIRLHSPKGTWSDKVAW